MKHSEIAGHSNIYAPERWTVWIAEDTECPASKIVMTVSAFCEEY
jgi:hypothetical protein